MAQIKIWSLQHRLKSLQVENKTLFLPHRLGYLELWQGKGDKSNQQGVTMDFTGSQKIVASREKVFNALLDPSILKGSVPGCESAGYVNDPHEGRMMKLVITTAIPGFKGPYDIFIKTEDAVSPSHVVLVTEPSSDLGTVKASCAIDLTDDAAGTNLNYATHAELSGKVGAIPEMLIKSSVKGAIDKFFSNFEKQVSSR